MCRLTLQLYEVVYGQSMEIFQVGMSTQVDTNDIQDLDDRLLILVRQPGIDIARSRGHIHRFFCFDTCTEKPCFGFVGARGSGHYSTSSFWATAWDRTSSWRVELLCLELVRHSHHRRKRSQFACHMRIPRQTRWKPMGKGGRIRVRLKEKLCNPGSTSSEEKAGE